MEDKDKKRGVGRPKEDLYQKYIAGHEDEIIDACQKGCDLKNLAEFLGMGYSTLKKVKSLYPEFKSLVDKGNEVANEAVESALFKRAIGYEAEDTITEVKVSTDGSAQTTFVRKSKRHVPGDTTAMIFWLKNRMSDKWRDKQDMNIDSSQPININIKRDSGDKNKT